MSYPLYSLSRRLSIGVTFVLVRRLPWGWAQRFGQNVTQSLGGVGLKLQQFSDMKIVTADNPLHGLPSLEDAPGLRDIITRLCPGLVDDLDTIDTQALHGSVARVVRARLKSGGWVALKMHRVGMTQAIQSDASFLKSGLRAMYSMRKGFDLNGYADFFSGELHGELDMEREAAIQERLHCLAASRLQYVIPKPIRKGITSQLLTMSWETSQPLVTALGLSEADRDFLLAQLSQAILDALFIERILIADLNPGNVGWRPSQNPRNNGPRLVLYDFGSALEVPSHQVDGFKMLLQSVKNDTDSFPALIQLGFDAEKLEPISDVLAAYLRLLFLPFITKNPFHLENWNRKEIAQDLLGDRRWLFMQAAPPELFAFMRCLYGWFHWHRVLKRPFQAEPLLFAMLNGTPASQTDSGLGAANKSMPSGASISKTSTSTQLHIQVTVQGNMRVKMTLPGHCASMLADLMDPEVRSQIDAKGIDIVQISQNAVDSGFAAGDLFRLEDSARSVHIFLA